MDLLKQIDVEFFLLLNGMNNGFWDNIMYWISHRFFWIPFYAILLTLIGIHLKWKGLLLVLPVTALMILISDQSSVFLKLAFERLRPCHEPSLSELVHTVGGKCGGQFGFVSSHAANTFALSAFIANILKKHIRWIMPAMFAWAAIVSYSRIYLGAHYPGDVIAGALLGIIISFFVFKIFNYFQHKSMKRSL